MEEFVCKGTKWNELTKSFCRGYFFEVASEIKYPMSTVGNNTPIIASRILIDCEIGIAGEISPKPTVHKFT